MLILKSRTRRAEIRKARPEARRFDWNKWKEEGVPASLAVAAAFFVCSTLILMYRQDVVPYRPGQWIPHNIVSRVPFSYSDKERLALRQFEARDREPRVYKPAGDPWADLRKAL